VLSSTAGAEYYEIIPSMYLTQEYNDNIFTTDNPISDFITTVGPDLAVLGMGERLDWNISGGLRFRKYAENELQDQQDWHVFGGLNYRPSERSSMFTDASFIMDTRPDRIEDGFVTRGVDRERYTFNIGGLHALSEVTSPFVNYRYIEEDFKFLPERNQRSNFVQLGINHHLDRFLPMTTVKVFVSYSHSDFATSDDDTARFVVGLEKAWKEKWSVHANLGARYTKSTFPTALPNPTPPPDFVTGEGTSEDVGPVTDLSLEYTGEYAQIRLTAFRDVIPAVGQGRSVEQVGLSGFFSRRFTEKISGRLNASIQTQESFQDLNPAQAVDRLSIIIQPVIAYNINRQWSIDGHYRYYYLNDQERSRVAVQNLIALTLNFRYPILK